MIIQGNDYRHEGWSRFRPYRDIDQTVKWIWQCLRYGRGNYLTCVRSDLCSRGNSVAPGITLLRHGDILPPNELEGR